MSASTKVALAASMLGCGGGKSGFHQCLNGSCHTPDRGFKVCTDKDDVIDNVVTTYQYGKTSCTCVPGTDPRCPECVASTAAYCDYPLSPCVATFSGAFSGTVTCGPATAGPMNNLTPEPPWGITVGGNTLVDGPGTVAVWGGFGMSFAGTATVGSFDQTLSVSWGSSFALNDTMHWYGDDQFYTSATAALEITTLGPSVMGTYATPHGTWSGTLTASPDATGTVRVDVTF